MFSSSRMCIRFHRRCIHSHLQEGFCLGSVHAGEAIEKLIQSVARLEIIDQCLDRHAGSSEDEGTAEDFRITLYNLLFIHVHASEAEKIFC